VLFSGMGIQRAVGTSLLVIALVSTSGIASLVIAGRTMPLVEISHRRIYRQVAEQIVALIRAGEYPPGGRLPAERDLAARLGVSRPSVREAIIALELNGYVEVRMGSGAYVAARLPRHAVADRGAGPFEQLKARHLIEGEIAAAAATVATRADLAEIAAAIDQMRAENARGLASEEGDRRFHVAIAQATRNATLADVTDRLWQRDESPMWRRLLEQVHAPVGRPLWIEDHTLILEALRARRPERARAAMHAHIDHVIAVLMAASAQDPSHGSDQSTKREKRSHGNTFDPPCEPAHQPPAFRRARGRRARRPGARGA